MSNAGHVAAEQQRECDTRTRRPEQDAAGPVTLSGDPAALLRHLQRTVGNQAVNALLRQYAAQRSAAVPARRHASGAADQEHEVDAAATGAGGLVQAAPEVGLEGGPLSPELSGRINSKRGGGAPLDAATRAGMEAALGTSLAEVRVHSDGEAAALNRAVSARAFTTGSDVFLGAGASAADSGLMAHELTHVVQQRGMSGSGGPLTVGPAGDSLEQEAEAMSAQIGAHPSAQRSPGAEIQRQAISRTIIQRDDGSDAPSAAPVPAPSPDQGPNQGTTPSSGSARSGVPNVDSDDYKQGYQDGVSGQASNAVPRDGQALTDYDEGYARGQYDASQQPQPGGDSGPNASQGPAYSPSPAPSPDQGPNQSVATTSDTAAYNAGFADGQAGVPSDPIGRVGFQYAQDYISGYNDGKATPKPSESENDAPYDGPSIGPTKEREERPEYEHFDEKAEYPDDEISRYLELKQEVSQWRQWRAVGGRFRNNPYKLRKDQMEEYNILFRKFGDSDPDPVGPVTEAEMEGIEAEEDEEEEAP